MATQHARTRRCALLLGALILLSTTLPADPASASRTRTFRLDSYEGLQKCDVTSVALGDDGSISLAPAASLLADPGVRTVWALTMDAKGRLLMATGDQGQVVAQSATGEANKPEVLATLFDAELFAIAPGDKGIVYAAGAPNGTIMRITPDGHARTLFDVPEGVIFSLLVGADGMIYAATGEQGHLYRVTPEGEGKIVNESIDQNLRSLAWAPGGKIYAGTDGRGLLLEISPGDGHARVLYDATEQEIASIVPIPGGGAFFAANPGPAGGGGGGDPPAGGDSAAPAGSQKHPITVSPEHEQAGGAEGGPHPVIYRLAADGSVRLFWRCPQHMLHAIALDPDGNVLAATSDAAALYRIAPDGSETVLWEPDEEQVLSLYLDGRTIYAGTGNPGRLYKLGPDLADDGVLTSDVQDARDQARWGVLRWEGVAAGGKVQFETRTGFTETPDQSWSDWTPVTEGAEGSMVMSPAGRFLQWRARLKRAGKESPLLRRIEVSYGGTNNPPRILSLRVSADEPLYTTAEPGHAGAVTQVLPGGVQIDYSLPPASPVISADDVPLWVRRIRSIVWEAQDPDGDELAYTLEIRAVGEEKFRLLAREIRDRGWSMESSTVPDGVYQIRLTVTDAPSNPPGAELTASRLTPPFHIDTVAPVVQDVKARRVEGAMIEVGGVAVDESSPLHRIEVSIDGGPFHWLNPTDGLMDSPREQFEGRVPLDPGQNGNWITVRAQDAAGNRGSYRVWLEPEAPSK